MANPTLRVIASPLAMTKCISFFSLATPIASSLTAGIQEYSLPVPTRSLGIRTDFDRLTWFATVHAVWNVPTLI
jgi:hypothetical protein